MSMVTYSDGYEATLGNSVQGKSSCFVLDCNVDPAGDYCPWSSNVWKLEGWSACAGSSCREEGKPSSILKKVIDYKSINGTVLWFTGCRECL